MANASEILSQFLNLPIGSGVSHWQANNPTFQDGYNQAAAEAAGVEYQPQIVDNNPLTANLARTAGALSYDRDKVSYRTDGQMAGDIISSVAGGFGGTVGGLAALGMGLVNDNAGAWVSQKVADANTALQDIQSAGLNNHRRANRADDFVDQADSERKYQEQRRTDGDFVAGLRKIGRNFISSAGNALSDPTILSDGVANAAGSLLVGGPAGKITRAVGSKLLSGLLRRGVIGEAAAIKAGSIGEKLVMPGTIGTMESGGAYQQTVQQVLAMDHDALMQSSPDYAQLIKEGWNPDDAKNEVATSAGLMAAAIQFPVAAAAGTLVSKFEANPFKGFLAKPGAVLKDGASEAIEEAVQSGGGQFAGNLGIKEFANQNQDLTEGVGEQAGLGALYGFGSAAGVHTPGLAANGAIGAAKLAGQAALLAGKKVSQPFMDRLAKIQTEREASSPISVQNLSAKTEEAQAALPEIGAQIDQEVSAGTLKPEQADPLKSHIDNLQKAIAFDPTELDSLPISGDLKTVLAAAPNRFAAIHAASQIANSPAHTAEDRIGAGIVLNDMLNRTGDAVEGSLIKAIEAAPDDHPALDQLRQFEDVVLNYQNNPTIQKVRQKALQIMSQVDGSKLTEQAVSTPQGQQAAIGVASAAETDPTTVSGDIADIVLEHARKGRIKLSDSQTKALNAASSIKRVGETYVIKSKKWKLKAPDWIKIVSGQILTDQNDDGDRPLSAAGHTKAVLDAYRRGDKQAAAEAMSRYMAFAQHLQNKLEARNQAYLNGNNSSNNTAKYQALMPGGKFAESQTGVYVSPKSKGSLILAQKTALEAEAVGNMANELALQMPELGVQPIELTQLHPDLQGNAETIAKAFQEGKQPTREAAPETSPTPEVKAEEAAKADPAQAEPSTVKAESTPTKSEPVAEAVPQPSPEAEPAKGPEQMSPPPATDATQPEAKQEEPKAVPVKEEAKAEPKTIEQAFPNLVGDKGSKVQNWFRRAFKLGGELRSRLLGTSSPATFIRDALKAGTKGDKTLSADVAKVYAEFLRHGGTVLDTMNARLQKALDENRVGKASENGPTFRQALLEGNAGRAVNSLARGRVFNLVQEGPDGKLAYNQELLEGAVLAGLQWLINAGNQARSMDAEDIARTFNTSEAEAANFVDFFSKGVWRTEAKRMLGDYIVRYWGVQVNRDAPEGYVKGIAEGMAAEVLRGLEQTGLIEETSTTIDGKTVKRYEFTEAHREVMDQLAAYPNAIEEAALVTPEDVAFIGKAPTEVDKTQLHNSPVPLSKQQQAAIEKVQNTPYLVNPAMLNFLEKLGRDGVEALFGKGNPSGKGINVNTARSMEGYNRTLTSAFDHLTRMIAQMRNQADTTGVEIEDLPVFFKFGISAVGRLQMQGRVNPQASKLVREVLLPTWSTLDLSDRNSDHYRAFMLAVAQHIGVKVHKAALNPDRVSTAIAEAEKLLSNDYLDVVKIMQETLADTNEIHEDQVDLIKAKMGDKLSVGAIHAIMEYARFLDMDEADRKAFKTGLYLEADGVTDGPVNALMNLTAGAFTPEWLDLMNRGGLYLGPNPVSLNDYVNGSKEQGQDLYQIATNFLFKHLSGVGEKLGNNGTLWDLNDALRLFLTTTLKEISLEGDGVKFDRGIAKNPLTVTVYGSGVRGIANKITANAIDGLYESISEGVPPSQDMLKALVLLGTHQISNEFGRLKVERVKADTNMKQGEDFTLTPSMVKNIETNLMHLFAKPLSGAVNEIMAAPMETAKLVRQATQIQSIYFKYAYKQAIADALKNQEGGATEGDFLSRKQLDKIFQDLIAKFPMIDTGTQMIWVGSSEKADVETAEFGSDLDNRMRSPGYTYGPENSGVSGIPYLVIATGDGQMVLNALTGEAAPENMLPVFDGMNMKLDSITEDSRKINEAVHQGWMQNPVDAVSKSFSKFIEKAGLDPEMSDEMRREIWSAIEFLGPDDVTPEVSPAVSVQGIQRQLAKAARELTARKNVLARVNMSVDHMASASAPFVKSDGIELPSDPAEAVTKLNEMYAEELAKLPDAEEVIPAAEVSEDITSFLGSIGETDSTGAVVIGRDALRGAINQLNIPLDQKGLVRAAINALATKGWKVLHGTAEQLVSYANANGIRLPAGLKINDGLALPGSKMIFMQAANSETLTHELLHAATIEQVHAYYTDPASVTPAVAEAVRRIEILRDEFFSVDPGSITDPETMAEYRHAFAAIQNQMDNTGVSQAVRNAAALNEFMAWVLANQKLADLARQTKVRSPLAMIVAKALATLKKLWRSGLAPDVRDDIFTNLKFNTLVIAQSPAPKLGSAASLSSLAQFQSRSYGESDRLSVLESRFINAMQDLADPQTDEGILNRETQRDMYKVEAQVRSTFQSAFPMTEQQASLFETMLTAFAVNEKIDPNAMARAQDLFSHVLENLKIEDFQRDKINPDEADRYQAQNKYDLIVGNFRLAQDLKGRSSLMPAFMALATVNDEFRKILAEMPLPKTAEGERSLDGVLSTTADKLMTGMARKLAGENITDKAVLSAINSLVDRLAQSDAERESFIEQFSAPTGNGIDKLNNWVVGIKDDWTQKGAEKLRELRGDNPSKPVEYATQAAEAVLGIFNEDIGSNFAMGMMSTLNKSSIWKPVSEIYSEIIGRTKENAPIFDMIKLARSFIQQLRQRYREYLPDHIAKQFSRVLTKQEWSDLHQGMAKTDLAALSPLGSSTVLSVLKDANQLSRQTAWIEAEITKLDPAYVGRIQNKAAELAKFMLTGKVTSDNLLRNANAIAEMAGELTAQERARRGPPQVKLVKAIDQLVTLYALKELPTKTRVSMADLASKETKGMEFTFTYLRGLRDEEVRKSWTDRARLNHYKGHVPSETRSGASLIVAEDSRHADLLARGYTRLERYQAAPMDRGPSRSYYFAPLSGKASFNQGIAQNIRHTFFGVDPHTGFSNDTHGAGRITKQDEVRDIMRNPGANRRSPAPLMPIFDDRGEIVAYERSIDPNHVARLEKENDLSKVIGMWRGRQVEEAAADHFNAELVAKLHDVWTDTPAARRDEFVDLLDPDSHKDPVITDAVKLLSPEMLKMIGNTFGGEGFMVRKDMINDAIGYRSASIGDLWTGVTRLPPQTAEVAANVLTAVMGKNAYKYLVTGEKLWQNFIGDARTTIVVRSVIVPAANIVSNVYQLAARGVPLAHIVKGMPRKLAEIQAYHKNRITEIQLEADILAAKNNPSKVKPLKAKLQAIKDSHKRLSIWPLIEAGEFSSVSEATINREESTLFEGNIYKYMEGLADKLPDAIKTVGKYAILSRDTALFQGLQRAVEYGDFLAKAVLYDDLVKRKGMNQDEALARIGEEYVNYDRMPGRFRASLENMGLLWFYHFKLRSLKVALSMVRNNPVHTLLTSLMPTPEAIGSVGLPTQDNIISKALGGTLGYSVGPMMGYHAHTLNPWINLID